MIHNKRLNFQYFKTKDKLPEIKDGDECVPVIIAEGKKEYGAVVLFGKDNSFYCKGKEDKPLPDVKYWGYLPELPSNGSRFQWFDSEKELPELKDSMIAAHVLITDNKNIIQKGVFHKCKKWSLDNRGQKQVPYDVKHWSYLPIPKNELPVGDK